MVGKSPFSQEDQIINEKNNEEIPKWKPNDINDIFRNKNNINIIKKFLDKKLNNTKSILLRGQIGCGKKEMIYILLKEYGYTTTIYEQEIYTKEEFCKVMDSIRSKGIMEMFNRNLKKAIIIKNYDINLKKNYQKELFDFIKDHEDICPIFITSNDLKISSSRGVPNCVIELNFEKPHFKNLVDLGKKILIENNTFSEYSINLINNIAKQCEGDIRHFENTLLNGIYNKGGKNNIQLKDLNLDVKIKINDILDPRIKFDKKLLLTSLHTNAVTYFNYIKLFNDSDNNNSRDSNDLEILNKLSEMNKWILMGLKNEKYVRKYQLWDNSDIYGIFGTIAPLIIVNKDRLDNLKKFEHIDYPPNINYNIEWRFSILESLVYSFRYIIKPSNRKNFIQYLINNYYLNDNLLKILCKLTNIKPNLLFITTSNKEMYKEIKLNKMRVFIKNN